MKVSVFVNVKRDGASRGIIYHFESSIESSGVLEPSGVFV